MNKVYVILVNYNGLQDTLQCINSIKESDYDGGIKIVVVDNASSEECKELNTIDCVKLIKNSMNVGFGVANNIGAEYAISQGAEYIMCLNNDTVVAPDSIRKLVDATNDNTIATCAIYYYGTDRLWYGGGEVSRLRGNFQHKEYFENRDVSFICGCCFVMSAVTYKRIALFDPDYFMYYEDGDFSLKAMENNINLRYLYDAKIWHKVGKSINKTVGWKDYYLTRNRLYLLKKYKNYFMHSAILYFWVSRAVLLTYLFIKNENIEPIIRGVKDYFRHKMGKM